MTNDPDPAALRLAVAVAGAGLPPLPPAPDPGGALSILCLPFQTPGGGPDEEVLADGLADDLIADLSRIREAKVIARSTAFAFKGRDARTAAAELAVRYIVEGSLRRRGDDIRVNVALVDARSGHQTWTERIDLPLAGWHELVDRVVGRIARELNLELMLAESRTAGARAAGTEAWSLALRGWVELFNKPQTATTNRTAMGDLNRAVSLDPGLALGWTGLAYATWRAAIYGWDAVAREDGLERAVALSRRAIGLDPSSADAHYVLAITLLRRHDLVGAEAAARTCLALNPNYAPGHANYGLIALFLGRVEETIPACERALELSPREPLRSIWHRNMALAGLVLGDVEYARRAARASVGANADYAYGQLSLAMAECAAGEPAAAREALGRFRALLPAETIASIKAFHRGADERFCTPYFALLERLEPLGLPLR